MASVSSTLPGANWRPYDGHIFEFNTTTEGVAVASDSAAIVQKVLSWSLPGNQASSEAGTSKTGSSHLLLDLDRSAVHAACNRTMGSNSLNGMQIRVPEDAQPAGGEDGHMTIVTPEGWSTTCGARKHRRPAVARSPSHGVGARASTEADSTAAAPHPASATWRE